MLNFTKKKGKYKFIPNYGVEIIENNIILNINDNKDEILNKLHLSQSNFEKTIFKYPDQNDIVEESIWIYDATISLTFRNNILSLIEVNHGENLYYDDINIGEKDYAKTIKALITKGYKYSNNVDDTYLFNEINLMLYCPSQELRTAGIYVDNYYENEDDKKYKIRSSKWGKESIIEYEFK